MFMISLNKNGPVAQLVRALVLWAEGRGFEPRRDQPSFWIFSCQTKSWPFLVPAITLLPHSAITEVTLHLPEMKQRLRCGCAVSSKTMFIDRSMFLLLSVSHYYSFSCILLNLLFLLPPTHYATSCFSSGNLSLPF